MLEAKQSDNFREVSFAAADGGKIVANLYGEGSHGVVLAHGAVFNKESWHNLATALSREGYSVLALDFRGYGTSVPGSQGESDEPYDRSAEIPHPDSHRF